MFSCEKLSVWGLKLLFSQLLVGVQVLLHPKPILHYTTCMMRSGDQRSLFGLTNAPVQGLKN